MKNLKIFLLLYFITFFNYSQSISDTQGWIKDQIDAYKTPLLYQSTIGDQNVKNTQEIIFEDGVLYFKQKSQYEDGDIFANWNMVNIKDIQKVEITHQNTAEAKSDYDKLKLFFPKGVSSYKEIKTEANKYGNYDYTQVNERSYFEINLSSKFIKEGMKKRMEKAFLHLIQLHGGIAEIKEEAF